MGDSYVQSYSGFVGVDFTSDPAYVARNRLAHCVNMWRDYDSENGAAIETFPGFRRMPWLGNGESSDILKVYTIRSQDGDHLVTHTEDGIYSCRINTNGSRKQAYDIQKLKGFCRSVGFTQNNRLFILNDKGYAQISIESGSPVTKWIMSSKRVHGEWEFHNNRPITSELLQTISFESANESWKGIKVERYGSHKVENNLGELIDVPSYAMFYLKDNNDSTMVAIDGEWSDDSYRIVNFSDMQDVSDIFYENICYAANPKKEQKYYTPLDVYIPTTYYNGKPYEQRNMLINKCYQIETGGGIERTETNHKNEEIVYVYIPLLEKTTYDTYTYDDIVCYVSNKEEDQITWAGSITDEIPLEDGETDSSSEGNSEKFSDRYIKFPKDKIWDNERNAWKRIKILYNTLDPISFGTIEEGAHRSVASLDYGGTSVDAILGCTKAAVYDGRVFLTGNPALPNTVFFSARNSTGANDPTYFGVYNYFNDGYGNTPNVDMLSTPSMLMVIKRDTVQDGSVYYHTGQDNTDDDSKNLIPRLYPSISGAAGLGSVGTLNSQGVLSCNFLDDTVFLTKRGLDGVSKEAVNLERTIGHRSYCVDKRLLKEDLSKASMAEWKGYLVICCNGHLYLADSRSRTQHSDGSYQYEWFYMEGLAARSKKQEYVYSSYAADEYFENGYSIDKQRAGELVDADKKIWDTNGIRYVEEDGVKYLVEALCYKPSDEKIKDVVAVGDRLFLISDRHIFLVNTDMERDELGRLTSEAYSFDECRYISGCSTKLDDCGRITVRKNTIYGLTVARFKTMRDSKCTVKTSINGVSFTSNLGEVTNFRQGFKDADYKNVSFDGDADNVAILPERSRGWIRKQYYFFSDRYCQPFGLYELSYHYQVAGKIR